MTGTTVKANELRAGDVVPSGHVIVAYLRLCKGGSEYLVRTVGGQERTMTFDGRRRIEVQR
jgi:hypothetical protein